MRYWWVNHKQTFRQEFQGGYVWCPKLRSNGTRNHFYETLREVRAGDLILSYAHAAVQGFGFASTHCYSCPRPDEFGKAGDTWDLRGWRSDVRFHRFSEPFRTAGFAAKIAPLLSEKYAPIRADGFGNQGAYFSEIAKPLALFILNRAAPEVALSLKGQIAAEGESLTDAGLPIITEWEDRQQKLIEATDLPETTQLALIQSRRGQGLFRQRVGKTEHACRITRVENPAHLIASHIKPWRDSDNEERLAAGNGLLLTPSIDHLFDRGFISFGDDGELITSPIADRASLKKMGISTEAPLKVGQFNSDQKHFLDFHRREVLLATAS